MMNEHMMNEHVNCRCVPDITREAWCNTALYDQQKKSAVYGIKAVLDDMAKELYIKIATPDRILKNGDVTIVFWKDGTKTIVKPEPGATLDDYTAFTAALAKRMFGSNSKLKKVIKTHTEYQVKKGKCKGGACDVVLPDADLKEGEELEAVPTSGSST